MTDETRMPPLLDLLGAHRDLLLDAIPHAKALGLELVDIFYANAVVKLPYNEQIIGNPETGVVHGGAVTTLLDNVSGVAVFCAIEELTSIATLDLRIDYMRAATPGKDITGHAHCYKLTRNVAFVRGVAYDDDIEDPIATSAGAFMMGSDGTRKPGANLSEAKL